MRCWKVGMVFVCYYGMVMHVVCASVARLGTKKGFKGSFTLEMLWENISETILNPVGVRITIKSCFTWTRGWDGHFNNSLRLFWINVTDASGAFALSLQIVNINNNLWCFSFIYESQMLPHDRCVLFSVHFPVHDSLLNINRAHRKIIGTVKEMVY